MYLCFFIFLFNCIFALCFFVSISLLLSIRSDSLGLLLFSNNRFLSFRAPKFMFTIINIHKLPSNIIFLYFQSITISSFNNQYLIASELKYLSASEHKHLIFSEIQCFIASEHYHSIASEHYHSIASELTYFQLPISGQQIWIAQYLLLLCMLWNKDYFRSDICKTSCFRERENDCWNTFVYIITWLKQWKNSKTEK